jgi:type II secretory pathway pseudopilin PulG
MRHKLPIIAALIATTFLACVAVPNLLVARNRSRQKRTMADMRTISTAWEARATDLNSYTVDPDPRDSVARDLSDFSKLHRVSSADLKRALVPKYLKEFPAPDGWGNEIEFHTGDYRSKGDAQIYVLRSLGSDHIADAGAYKSRAVTKFEDDLVFTNGTFLQFPEGV